MNPKIPEILQKITLLAENSPISEGKKIISIFKNQIDNIDYNNVKIQYDKAVKLVLEKPSLAAKAFIVDNDNKLLIIKRSNNDIHKPSIWEIPGGRLKQGENPQQGLARETKEEVGLDIEIKNLLEIHHFTRDDGQKISMNVYLCRPLNVSVKLSPEHTDFEWIHINNAKNKLTKFFHKEVDTFKQQN